MYQAWGGPEFHITQQSLTDFIRGGAAPWEETPDSAAKHLLHGRHLYNAAHNKRRSEQECRWPVLALVYGALIGCSSGHPSPTWHLKFCNLKCKLKSIVCHLNQVRREEGNFGPRKEAPSALDKLVSRSYCTGSCSGLRVRPVFWLQKALMQSKDMEAQVRGFNW